MKTCFVIMPIGDIPGVATEAQLKERYADLIKEAILRADPTLEVVRADDVAAPGVITTDILTRLMHSDVVIADITFPNPNVYYELGIRHAVRPGTILIRGTDAKPAPFDTAALRHTPYENTPAGLKALAGALAKQFAWLRSNPGKPDSGFLELAHVTKYTYPRYEDDGKAAAAQEMAMDVMLRVMSSPRGMAMLRDAQQRNGEPMSLDSIAALVKDEPELARDLMKLVSLQQGGFMLAKPKT